MKLVSKIALLIALVLLSVLAMKFIPLEKHSGAALVGLNFVYSFNVPGVLEEAGSMAESHSPYWWLSSGGLMEITDGKGGTHQGDLPTLSRWRLLYRVTNPLDTDNGHHPQNIFRLVSRNVWQNFREEAYFKIITNNLSESPNRNISNGILLLSRYVDQHNLYYAGLRVDGTAIIKKKREGEYLTLAQEKVFEGEYDRHRNPSLLPKDKWLGIRMETQNMGEVVFISLYADLDDSGEWQLLAEATDMIDRFGTPPLQNPGFAGIRTDFMDVQFKDFRVSDLPSL